MDHVFFYHTELGVIGIRENGRAVTGLFFGATAPKGAVTEETALLHRAAEQLDEYLRGERTAFDLPLEAEGTAFQKSVWRALLEIPYGQTRSYGDIARRVGSPKACRAVGMANNRNPIAVMIPCHRVVGANGALVGYGGGLPIKKKLLELENPAAAVNESREETPC